MLIFKIVLVQKKVFALFAREQVIYYFMNHP
jgi:hypothetical protein